jgi:AcrR family transcriptional regulator
MGDATNRTIGRRPGRPPATSSDETRARILDSARKCFAERGYETTTNKILAGQVGLTTGAIYHYFESKQDLYVAVHREVQATVYARFQEAVAANDTFIDQFDAVLDGAVQLNNEDPSLAIFLGTVRADAPRHPELGEELAKHTKNREEFLGEIVDTGIATGEIDRADRRTVMDVLSTILIGLTIASSGDPAVHRRCVEGFKRLIAADLFQV